MDKSSESSPTLETLIGHLERHASERPCDDAELLELARQALTRYTRQSRVIPFPSRSKPAPSPTPRHGNTYLLDYLYGMGDGSANPLGSGNRGELQRYAREGLGPRALRTRRLRLAQAIDNACERYEGRARILCVDAGHLREAELSSALCHKRFQRFVALDSSPEHLQQVERNYAWLGVETLYASVGQLLAGVAELDEFDLIYSAGLVEQLDDSSAEQLTRQLFRHLAVGGRLLLANFQPGVPNISYLEALLDWRPRYRDDQALLNLLLGVPYNSIASARVSHDNGKCIGFLEAIRYG